MTATVATMDTAQLIGQRKPFKTYGSLYAQDNAHGVGAGYLNHDEETAFYADRPDITYVVVSYFTPIAWVTKDGRVHVVGQKFSRTTSRHQSRLYRLEVQA